MMNENGIEGLIKFWRSYEPVDGQNCVHMADHDAMNSPNIGKVSREMSSASKFFDLTSPEQDRHFHLSLSPVPYLGNLRTADIFLLMLNPKATYSDYYTNVEPAFRQALARARTQDFVGNEEVCLALNHQVGRESWFSYYEKLLRPTISKYAETYGKKYWHTLGDLSRRLAILELVPYYSANADQITENFVRALPSARKAKKAAQELRKRAKTGGFVPIKHRNGLGGKGRDAILNKLNSEHNPADPVVIVRWSYDRWFLEDGDSPEEPAA
jgi:hypothetical protein